MAKIRVADVARSLGITSSEALQELKDMGADAKSAASTIDMGTAERLGHRVEAGRLGEDEVRRGWREFGSLVGRLRRQHGWTQAELGEAVGAGGSWVSQVEAGSLVPGPDRTVRLGVVLGPEVSELAARLRGESPQGSNSAEALTLALLWRGRADLLGRMAAASRSRASRMRFDRLSRDLLAAASAHPSVGGFLDRAQLRPLSVLAEGAPSRVRQVVAVELATMKIDAPYETETDLKSRLDLMDFVLEDLGLSSAHASLRDAVARAVRKRPAWSELPPCGGPLGLTSMVRGALDLEQVLLIGHDPAGWLGADFAGGQWLLPPAADHRESGPSGLFPPDARSRSATGGVVVATGIAVAGAAAAGLGILLPVVTPLVIAGAVAMAQRPLKADQVLSGMQSEETPSPFIVGAGELAVAFGWAWTRVETTKLLTLYSAFDEPAKGLPAPAHLAEYLKAQASQVWSAAERERELSGTVDLDRNAPLRNLVDVADSIDATATRLEALAH